MMADRIHWTVGQAQALFDKPLLELLFEAQTVHRQHFDPRQVQVSTLLSIKTGACPEDCKYCPQSSRYKTGLESERLMQVEQVLESARKAKANGSTRFCMGAAWKNPHERDMPYLQQMVQGVKAMGMETCMTLGTLDGTQAERLAEAGLDYYNHNLDTSPEFYGRIITTRTQNDRLDTLTKVRKAGIRDFHVINGDINRPAQLASDLEKLGLDVHDFLHIRSFLDHNRPYLRLANYVSGTRRSRSTGAFAYLGEEVLPDEQEENLVRHLRRWAPYIGRFGLIALELHTLPPELAAANLHKTSAVAYDGTHGFSDQYLVELPVFLACAGEAGLKTDASFQAAFPPNELSTVSLNYFTA